MKKNKFQPDRKTVIYIFDWTIIKIMKKKYLFLASIISLATIFFSFNSRITHGHFESYIPPRSGGAAAGGLGDRTGSPVGSGASCTQCHGGGSFNPSVSISVLDNNANPVSSYVPGDDYTVEFTVTNGTGTQTGYAVQGLSISPSGGNAQAGDFTSTLTSNTRITSTGGREYIEHQGISSTGIFRTTWTAPNAGFGNITIYARGMAANGNGGTSGDETSASVTYNLTEVCVPNSGVDTQIVCDSLVWIDGNTYTTNNTTATFTATNIGGCDSIVTLDLTVNNSITTTDTQVICGSYTWIDGNTYTETNNTATEILTTSNGCDSIINLDLTILNNSSSTDTQVVCDSFTWIDGNTYTDNNSTATFITSNSVGCDSTITLNLTINNSDNTTDVISACGSYTWIDGNTYTQSNNSATFTLQNINGCDSIITLDLTMNVPVTGTDIQTTCDSLVWIDGNTYFSDNNNATHILTSSLGCDSIVTLNLTVTNVNTGITLGNNGLVLLADEANASYQWITCADSTLIDGAVSQNFEPTLDGNYAVEVTQNGCSDTSNCITVVGLGINDETFAENLILYPNPTNGNVQLDLGEQFNSIFIEIVDLNGKVISFENFEHKQLVNFKIDAPNGIYQLKIKTEDTAASLRIIKQ